MRLEILPFSEEHVDAAAELLAARHRADRGRAPELRGDFESPEQARTVLQAARRAPGAAGVVAARGGRAVGFLLGSILLPAPTSSFAGVVRPRSAHVPYGGHAAAPDEAHEAYREMYGALAPRWLEHGCVTHYIDVPATDRAALDAWSSLGFGQEITLAARDTAYAAEGATTAEIHRVGTEDIDVVMGLLDMLALHHATPPIFFPYLVDAQAEQREHELEGLADEAQAYWIAYRDGDAVGLQTFHPPPPFLPAMATPESCTYLYHAVTDAGARGGGIGRALLSEGMAWARDVGYRYCSLHFMSANISGARFWLQSGFRPLSHRLCRHLDDRILWAHGRG